MADRDVFREIPLNEFRRRHDHVSARISLADIAGINSKLFAEAYSINPHMEENDIAVNFSVRVERLDTPPEDPLGLYAVKLTFYSGLKLQLLENVQRTACIHPQSEDGSESAIIWHFMPGEPFRTANFSAIQEGFLTHWVDDDISDESRDEYNHPERTNITVNSPLLHQRSPFSPPTKREEQ